MKHSEIYDKHVDRRKPAGKQKKKNSDNDGWENRKARVSFKNHIRNIRQAELEDDIDDIDINDTK